VWDEKGAVGTYCWASHFWVWAETSEKVAARARRAVENCILRGGGVCVRVCVCVCVCV
jgi:hypothetical protein